MSQPLIYRQLADPASEARSSESQQLDQVAKDVLDRTLMNKDAKQDSRIVKAWGLGIGRR